MNTRLTASVAGTMALLFLAATALAADLTGKWTGHINDPGGGSHDLTLELKSDGDKVTGTMTGGPPNGDKQRLSGKLAGDDLSFDIKAQGPGGEAMTLSFKGKVSGNHIVGSHDSPMGPIPWEVTKK
jgi:autotransporter translocation and assembly factor TamB